MTVSAASRSPKAIGHGRRTVEDLITAWRRDQRGAAVVEYALVIGLIAITCVAAMSLIGQEISTVLSNLASDLSSV